MHMYSFLVIISILCTRGGTKECVWCTLSITSTLKEHFFIKEYKHLGPEIMNNSRLRISTILVLVINSQICSHIVETE